MSFLTRTVALHRLKHIHRAISSTAVRKASYNYDDFKPGPYPKTREEREAAAKKYGLHPSEYEPYPDDGMGYGDYPKLPDIAVEERDPFYPWDQPDGKRNFGEPIHVEIDYISEDRYNISMKPRYTLKQMLATFLGIMSVSFGLFYLAEPYPIFRPVLEKQLPAQGKTHYTFEPLDSSTQPQPELANPVN